MNAAPANTVAKGTTTNSVSWSLIDHTEGHFQWIDLELSNGFITTALRLSQDQRRDLIQALRAQLSCAGKDVYQNRWRTRFTFAEYLSVEDALAGEFDSCTLAVEAEFGGVTMRLGHDELRDLVSGLANCTKEGDSPQTSRNDDLAELQATLDRVTAERDSLQERYDAVMNIRVVKELTQAEALLAGAKEQLKLERARTANPLQLLHEVLAGFKKARDAEPEGVDPEKTLSELARKLPFVAPTVPLLSLYNLCVELIVPVEGLSGRNLSAWGAFAACILDALVEQPETLPLQDQLPPEYTLTTEDQEHYLVLHIEDRWEPISSPDEVLIEAWLDYLHTHASVFSSKKTDDV